MRGPRFPRRVVEELGYNLALHGQKSYNGVAILSKRPLDESTGACPAAAICDQHARYIEAVIPGDRASSGSPRSICPMAIRSAPTNSPTNSTGWTA